MKEYLKVGTELQLRGIDGTYFIREVVGRGSSCVVYRANFINEIGVKSEHLLKEFNPKNINIGRNDDLSLRINTEEQKNFDVAKKRFRDGFRSQLSFREKSGLKNYTANIQNVYEDFNTVYIDMNVTEGISYDLVEEKSIYNLARRMKVLAQIVEKYHENGYLHLDLKPSNIYVRPETETCEDMLLFDFDSMVKKTELRDMDSISYTEGWAALELTSASRRNSVCEATDVFAIGEIFFEKLMGRHSEPWERRTSSKYVYDFERPIFQGVNPKVIGCLDELLRNTLCNTVSSRCQSMSSVILMLERIANLSNPEKPYLINSRIIQPKFFIGREKEVNDIYVHFQEKHILFLNGMGGIGKSELARNYAVTYGDKYDVVFFSTYIRDFVTLLADDNMIPIYNFCSYQEEKIEDYAKRKLRKLKELSNQRVLFIIDNFDNIEDLWLKEVLAINAHILVTTRMDVSIYGYEQIQVGELQNKEDILDVFRHHYVKTMDIQEFVCVEEIINMVCSHTMAVELLAKQMRAGRVQPDIMLERLKNAGLGASCSESVVSNKDGKHIQSDAYGHLKLLFDVAELNEQERFILINLSVIPVTGISAELFYKWCELENYDTMNQLITEGWIRFDKEADQVSLHPLVAEIVIDDISKTCKELDNLLKNGRKPIFTYSKNYQSEILNLLPFMVATLHKRRLSSIWIAGFILWVCSWREVCINKSLEFVKYAVEMVEEIQGKENKVAYYYLAQALCEEGEFYEAEHRINEFLSYCLSEFTSENDAFQESYKYQKGLMQLALIYDKLEKYDDAMKILHRLSDFYKNKESRADIQVQIYMGLVSHHKQQYHEAIKYFENALKYTKANQTPAMILLICNIQEGMARSYSMLGELERSNDLFYKSLELRKGRFPAMKEHLAGIYLELSYNCIKANQLSEAQMYLQQASDLLEDLYDSESYRFARMYHLMSCLYEQYGEVDKAVFYAKKSCSLREQRYGETHRLTKESKMQLEKCMQQVL